MKRRSHIDLTPLLDVILLMVFGFMFILTSTTSALDQSRSENERIADENAALVETLTDENATLSSENAALAGAIENQGADIEKLNWAISQYFHIDRQVLESALSKQDAADAGRYLDHYADENNVAYEMVLYDLLKAEFYFVEVVLSGETNQIFINGNATPVAIASEDAYNPDKRDDLIIDVKREISSVIDARPGGSAMVFVTLSTDNIQVYHYAWDAAWDAITALQEKYGAKDYYCAEIFIMREEQ